MLLRFEQKVSLRSLFSQSDKLKVALAHLRRFYFNYEELNILLACCKQLFRIIVFVFSFKLWDMR